MRTTPSRTPLPAALSARVAAAPSLPRLAAASLAGTAIEFYDFLVYGIAAALVLGTQFFPTISPLAGTLAALATFGVGFVARPLGSALFGHLGDRRGRRPVLMISLLLTGLATVAVGCLPTYDSIGIAAPVLLVVLRFVQGIGVGGEWGGAVLLTAEHAPAGRRGLWSSFAQIGPPLGSVLANSVMLALSAALSDAQFTLWGWRLPFLFAGVLTAAGLALRTSLPESPDFLGQREHARMPLVEVARAHWRLLLLTAGALATGAAVSYTMSTWALSYAVDRLGVDRTVMLGCTLSIAVITGALTPVAAVLGDRYGRRPLCLLGCAGCAVWMFPMIGLLSTGRPPLIFLGFLVAMLVCVTMLAVVAAYLPELYVSRVRCTGASVGYNLGAVLGGALTPMVATTLAHGPGTPWGVAAYLTAIALLSLGCFALLPDTRPAAVQPVAVTG
ncbi:MFS transporter [Streptomyces sp. NPDC050610]|uniref:MFS transporter n=1 Tax=Streptomyces sp. NPDC050610 TaxID=3157097 RepID=UPI003430E9DB